MTLNEYQTKANKTILEDTIDPFHYAVFGLCSEAGEVAGKIKKALRDTNGEIDIHDLVSELGDVLWYVAAICTYIDVTLEDVAKENIKKVSRRALNGTTKGSGDHR